MREEWKTTSRWHSERLEQPVNLARWGWFGQPVLLFPTAGGDFEECERFLMMEALAPLLEAGRIKIYSVDSVAGAAWLSGKHSPRTCSWLQNQFDAFIAHEVVPAIHHDCRTPGLPIITAGASIGAFNAVATLCRHPEHFSTAIGMSGTYDLSRWLDGDHNPDFYFSSPMHYLPGLSAGTQLDQLRERFVILATGEGRWEAPDESWRMASVLGAQGIPNRVDGWGPNYDHDWMTWREMLPKYLDDLT